jgi:hypothetical protein
MVFVGSNKDVEETPVLSSQFAGGRQMMTPARVLGARIYRGPHLYSQTPMVQITLDLGELENWPTNKLDDFASKLLEMLPGLQSMGAAMARKAASSAEWKKAPGWAM